MNSSHERGQGKCAFADEFQTLIKRGSSGLVCLRSTAERSTKKKSCYDMSHGFTAISNFCI